MVEVVMQADGVEPHPCGGSVTVGLWIDAHRPRLERSPRLPLALSWESDAGLTPCAMRLWSIEAFVQLRTVEDCARPNADVTNRRLRSA